MKKILLTLVLMLVAMGIRAQSWQAPNDGAYNHETVLYLSLTGSLDNSKAVIGAFIGDECRASAGLFRDDSSGAQSNFFLLRVQGDNTTDHGKAIVLKVYDGDTGLEYTPASSLTFDGETQGRPSAPIAIALNAAQKFSLSFTEAEVGQSYDLTEYVKGSPDGYTMPDNLSFVVSIPDDTRWIDPTPYASVKGSVLTATATYESSLLLQLISPNQSILAESNFNIVQYATGIRLTSTSFQVNKNESYSSELDMFMRSAYTLEPEGATPPAVEWETDPTAAQDVLQWSARGYYVPVKGGTTRIRPFFTKRDGTKVVPSNGWITVTVVVPVTGVTIDAGIFGGTFKANVGDTHLYERLAKMITVSPADATDKSYSIEVTDNSIVGLTGATSLTALAAGTTTIVVTPNAAASGSEPVSAMVRVQVENPPTHITLGSNQLHKVLTDGQPLDISNDVRRNVTLNGDASMWSQAASVSVSGSAVNAVGAAFSANGLDGTFTAVAAGTATVSITLTWNDYDSWGISSNTLQTNSVTASFSIVVSEQSTLTGFSVAITGAVAGQTGTMTLTPVPEGATFTPDDISVTMFGSLYADYPGWSGLFTYSRKSADANAIVYEFYSPVPDGIGVSVTGTGTVYPVNDPTAAVAGSFEGFEIGWPLSLSTGWQWRSNPCGFIPQSDFVNVFSTEALTEIRTQDDLLYNDPKWGFYGTLNNTVGLLEDQCYKIKMKQPASTVLYPSSSINLEFNVEAFKTTEGNMQFVLNPGWNWVGNPYLFDRKPGTVFANAVLPVGTVIVGKNGSAELGVGGTWQGDLTVLTAGEGYIIKNSSENEIEVSIPAETSLTAADETVAGARSMKKDGVWIYDHSRFMNNMTIVAVLVGLNEPERFTVGAFVGDECRGEGLTADGLTFITVHCDAGEIVSFRLYDTATGVYANVTESVASQTRLGSLKSPLVLHADLSAQGIDDISTTTAATTAYDLLGRSMSGSKRGIGIRRAADGTFRKVVMK